MNATRFATVIAPHATRKPPTPSTTSSDTCSAMPATGTTSAETFATLMPAAQAPAASASTVGDLAVGGVRGAHRADRADRRARRAAARSPTFSCCSRLATRMRPESSTTATTETPMTSTVEPEQHGVDDQHRDERADEDESAADRVGEALGEHRVEQRGVGADARDEVAGAAGVELADRQVQHPRDEAAACGEHDRGAGALQQVVLVAAEQCRTTTTRATSAQTSEPSGVAASARRVMTWLTSSGWARVAAAPSTLSTMTTTSTALCSREVGQQLAERGARARRRRCGRTGCARGASRGEAARVDRFRSSRCTCLSGCVAPAPVRLQRATEYSRMRGPAVT